jgi:hypothetical protein
MMTRRRILTWVLGVGALVGLRSASPAQGVFSLSGQVTSVGPSRLIVLSPDHDGKPCTFIINGQVATAAQKLRVGDGVIVSYDLASNGTKTAVALSLK